VSWRTYTNLQIAIDIRIQIVGEKNRQRNIYTELKYIKNGACKLLTQCMLTKKGETSV